jgi:hypothetical protein
MSEEKVAKKFMSPKEIIFTVIFVLILGGLYAMTLNSYLKEGQNAALPYVMGNEQEANSVFVSAKVLSIDPVKGEMSVRFDLTPQGSLTETDGLSATQNLKVFVNGATGQMERTFEKGKTINPFDAVISIDGLVNNYPFDDYASQMVVAISGQADKDAPEEDIPVVVQLTANIPGFEITADDNKESSLGVQIIDFTITRSSTVINVAVVGMVIMWAIAIAVIFLTMAYVFRNRKAEAFAFYSGLLFGLFGLRNSLPGTPPIGTQSDFLAFVWVEAIVAVMMVVTITISLVRPQK